MSWDYLRHFFFQKEAVTIWNILTHFFTFTGGMAAGVTLMCLLQAGKQEDEWRDHRNRRNED